MVSIEGGEEVRHWVGHRFFFGSPVSAAIVDPNPLPNAKKSLREFCRSAAFGGDFRPIFGHPGRQWHQKQKLDTLGVAVVPQMSWEKQTTSSYGREKFDARRPKNEKTKNATKK